MRINECCIGDKVRIVDDGGFQASFVKQFDGRIARVEGFLTYRAGAVRLLFDKDGRKKPFDAIVHVKFLEHA